MNSFNAGDPVQQVLDELKGFYAIMGNPPETVGALAGMAAVLTERSSLQAINAALNRCMVECRFPVRLPDIFSRIPGFDADVNAEKRLAWDTVLSFTRKYVGNDVYGNFGPEHGWYPKNFPQLSTRILDTVRRTGGWAAYAKMAEEDFPFQQKRFFEEYQAWTEIQHVASDPSKVLEMPARGKVIALIAEPIPTPREKNPEPVKIPAMPVKDFYKLPTEEEWRDRATLAKARLLQYLKQKQEAQA
jgi:hypothetical protein